MICLNVEKLSLSFGTKKILEDVTFSLDEGDKLGIIGINGCGKSTLFKLILGEYEPDSGNVYISKNKTVGVLRQNDAFGDLVGADENLSALDVMIGSFPELLELEARLASLEALLHSEDT
ncbi:MAG: ABC-F family ATP-binding cassette domain-containing protein, partial [Clostridia bacterium]|nr:ABC-F family ATP-binding cassette domain-containing protein [Clostridia bacterium]